MNDDEYLLRVVQLAARLRHALGEAFFVHGLPSLLYVVSIQSCGFAKKKINDS